jgi:GTP diphosphokinase / guanosine-3',5'-bis(diphosphate) 3'-diphosphatase
MKLEEITSLLHNPTEKDLILVKKAYTFALHAHEGHLRANGEPYFNHLFATAKTLSELGMSAKTVAAGLLHDSIEDTKTTPEDIEKEFGREIRFLVEGVTKLGKLKYRGAVRYSESLRKLFVAMSQDVRVPIIKLCDRLHNMQTLGHIPKEKQLRVAKETLEIYAPIAYRLGIKKLQKQLEDLAFAYVYPEDYKNVQKFLKAKIEEQETSLNKFQKSLKKELAKNGVVNFHTDNRVKGLYSLYKKLLKYHTEVEKIYDVLALRITVREVADCYKILGIIHGTWRPLPGRIKDYIATPKLNGYRSIHTTIFTGDGSIVEIQIRTEDMHNEAEYGVASHISYKESYVPEWVKKLVTYQKEVSGGPTQTGEFIENIKTDFLLERIFVFTPVGDVIDLPVGSTIIDFAYAIHSDIGDHMSGARVNGKFVSIDTMLKNDDRVEIETKKSAKPSAKWLEHCKTSLARRHISKALEQK